MRFSSEAARSTYAFCRLSMTMSFMSLMSDRDGHCQVVGFMTMYDFKVGEGTVTHPHLCRCHNRDYEFGV